MIRGKKSEASSIALSLFRARDSAGNLRMPLTG